MRLSDIGACDPNKVGSRWGKEETEAQRRSDLPRRANACTLVKLQGSSEISPGLSHVVIRTPGPCLQCSESHTSPAYAFIPMPFSFSKQSSCNIRLDACAHSSLAYLLPTAHIHNTHSPAIARESTSSAGFAYSKSKEQGVSVCEQARGCCTQSR